MADYIREDLMQAGTTSTGRPCTANHSANGVIELMPESDASRFAFRMAVAVCQTHWQA